MGQRFTLPLSCKEQENCASGQQLPSLPTFEHLTNICLVFLLSNKTSVLQHLDQGCLMISRICDNYSPELRIYITP